jgi:hypothetical protein
MLLAAWAARGLRLRVGLEDLGDEIGGGEIENDDSDMGFGMSLEMRAEARVDDFGNGGDIGEAEGSGDVAAGEVEMERAGFRVAGFREMGGDGFPFFVGTGDPVTILHPQSMETEAAISRKSMAVDAFRRIAWVTPEQHDFSPHINQFGNAFAEIPATGIAGDVVVQRCLEAAGISLRFVRFHDAQEDGFAGFGHKEAGAIGDDFIETKLLVDGAMMDVEPILHMSATDVEKSDTQIQLFGESQGLALRGAGQGLVERAGIVGAGDGQAVEREPIIEALHPVATSGSKGMGQHKACAKKQWQSHVRGMTGKEPGNNRDPTRHLTKKEFPCPRYPPALTGREGMSSLPA